MCTPRFSLINDPYISKTTKITKTISDYSQNHKLQNWMRPSIINIELIYSILSNEIQEYLNKNISAKSIANKLENKLNSIIKNEI
jgi:multiple sugar transport system substrate-binding protein